MDIKARKKYRQMLSQVEAKVDSKPPKFDVHTYYKQNKLKSDEMQIKRQDGANLEFLKRLNMINRFGGKVGSFWDKRRQFRSNFNENQETQNDFIKGMNRKLLNRIRESVSQYCAKSYIENWREMQRKAFSQSKRFEMEQKSQVLTPEALYEQCLVRSPSILKNMNPSVRTRCFFEIERKDTRQKFGKIVFELYDDIVPQTCSNFAEFCRGTNGLSYKNTPFHRIVSGYWCQGGDVTKFNGTGGASIFGDSFGNENFDLRHAGPGILSMCNNDNHKNDSKFNLTFKRLETMDGKRVVFGKVVAGIGNIYKIEEFGTKTGKPITILVVSNCGILPQKKERSTRKSHGKFMKNSKGHITAQNEN